MAKTATVHTRIDPKIKAEAEAVLHKLGMKPSEAVQIFYQQLALRRAFPIEIKLPNAETERVLRESDRNRNIATFSNKEDLFEDLGL